MCPQSPILCSPRLGASLHPDPLPAAKLTSFHRSTAAPVCAPPTQASAWQGSRRPASATQPPVTEMKMSDQKHIGAYRRWAKQFQNDLS